jgi:tryptophan 2,3-dioxygenase
MEPEQFLQFRMALLPASGFQSAQYRMIEIRATPLQNLLQFELRESTEAAGSTTKLLENIYWGRGAAELLTGNKTLTLKQFEAKYGAEFLRLAEEMKGKTLYEVFQGLPESDRQRTDLREALRTFDRQVNIDWPLMHYKSAVRYLKREPEDIAATGGTNWQKYLAPKNQMRIFFPELWTEQERKEWGRH